MVHERENHGFWVSGTVAVFCFHCFHPRFESTAEGSAASGKINFSQLSASRSPRGAEVIRERDRRMYSDRFHQRVRIAFLQVARIFHSAVLSHFRFFM